MTSFGDNQSLWVNLYVESEFCDDIEEEEEEEEEGNAVESEQGRILGIGFGMVVLE
jgi:hypothetical protein